VGGGVGDGVGAGVPPPPHPCRDSEMAAKLATATFAAIRGIVEEEHTALVEPLT